MRATTRGRRPRVRARWDAQFSSYELVPVPRRPSPRTLANARSRDFLRTIAPRIAYANPTLPIAINRYKDPRSKSLDPKSPHAGAAPWTDGAPGASLTVSFHERPEQVVPLRHLSADQIWKQVLAVCGEDGGVGIEAPKEEAKGEVTPEAKEEVKAEAEASPEAKA